MKKNKDQVRAEFTEILSRNGIKFGDGTIRIPANKHLGINLLGKIDFFVNHCGLLLVK